MPDVLLSRSSPLARAQVHEFIEAFEASGSRAPFEYQFIESWGDKQKNVSLLEGGAPEDFFTRELDKALLEGRADWALHSAKDLPRSLAHGLKFWALLAPQQLKQTDSLISSNGSLKQLPLGAKVGTSSPSRKQQLLALRSDLEIVSLRGTIEERVAYVFSGKLDAVVIATCALERLGLDLGVPLPFHVHPLQGYLALIGRKQTDTTISKYLAQLDVRKNWGCVTLLGAGSGGPGLLTLEGQRALLQADVIFYDALVSSEILDLSNIVEKIYVGKRHNDHNVPQSEISRRLWYAARQGKQVVRLKGGDALLFARAAEELQALDEALVSYRVLPGISAAFAAAASMALPLTRRGDGGSSLHLLSASPPERIDFCHLPRDGNIIFYMGLTQRREIQRRAFAAGHSPNEPVLLVLWASLPQQKNIYTSLAQLPYVEIEPKAIGLIMLGPIAAADYVAARSRPAATLPDLRGKTWITGLNPSMDADTPPELVWHLPLLELSERSNQHGSLDAELLAALKRATLVLFTSKHAVRYFFASLARSVVDLRLLGGKRVVSIGKATTCELQKFGLHCKSDNETGDWESPEESSQGLLAQFASRRKYMNWEHILLPSSNKALSTLIEGLPQNEYGCHSVERVLLYDNIMRCPDELAFLSLETPDFVQQWQQLNQLRAVYLSSPSTVEYFAQLVAKPLQQRFGTGFPGRWEYRCKGKPTRERLAKLQAEYGILGESL